MRDLALGTDRYRLSGGATTSSEAGVQLRVQRAVIEVGTTGSAVEVAL